MSRILFVVPPLTGHINPTVAVGAELAARGHDVAWAGHPAMLRSLLPGGALVFPANGDAFEPRLADVRDHRPPPHGPAAMKFVWEDLILPLADAMLPGVAKAVARGGPPNRVGDPQAHPGALAFCCVATVLSVPSVLDIGPTSHSEPDWVWV